MQYRRLGRSGLMVSELTLGTMNLGGPTDEPTSLLMIDKALDHGINLLDCANVYADRITNAGIKIAQKVSKRAKENEWSPASLSVSWILHKPAITSVIIGPRTPEHLDDLVSAQNIHLLPEDLAWFDTLVPPGTNVSDHFNTAGWRRPIQTHIH